MAPSAKPVDGRRKSGSKPSLIVNLTVPSALLRDIIKPVDAKEEESPASDAKEAKPSPTDSVTLPVANSTAENGSDSNTATPVAESTPVPMGPPVEGAKKKGVKRSAPNANGTNDGIPKPRGKPGPKKKPRL